MDKCTKFVREPDALAYRSNSRKASLQEGVARRRRNLLGRLLGLEAEVEGDVRGGAVVEVLARRTNHAGGRGSLAVTESKFRNFTNR